MWASTAPAVIDALVRAFSSAPELEGADVRDGPALADIAAQQVLCVGYSEDGSPAVDTQITLEGAAATPDRERYTITCIIAVLDGAGDIAAARRRAYELLAGAGQVIARDHTLGGLALRTSIGSASLVQDQGDRGAQALLSFGVDVDAFTGRR
jgi:hypothetical protein